MATIRSLMVRLGFSSNISGLVRAKKAVDNLNTAVMGIGAAAAGMAMAFKQTIDIERSVGKAMSIVDKSGSQFHSMKNQMMKDAMDMAETLGFAAKEIGEGFYQVISAGVDPTTSKFKSLSELGFKMAKLGDMAPADAIEKLNDTLNAFALQGDQYARVADVVFKASNLSAVTIPQLVEAMRDAGPAAYQAGLSLEETSAIIATMAERGIKGAEAGVAFRMIMNRIASGPGKEALAKMGISAFDAHGNMLPLVDVLRKIQAAQADMTSEEKQANTVAIAGRYAYSKLGGLLSKNMDVLEGWTKQLENSGGSMNRAFIQYSSLAGESLTKLKHSIINLIATMGTPFLKPIAGIADYFRELTFGARKEMESNSDLGKSMRFLTRVIVGGGGLLAAMAALYVSLGLISKMGKFVKLMFLSPFGKGTLALLLPLLLLIEVIDTLRGNTTWLGEWFKETTDEAWKKYSEMTGTPIMKKPDKGFRDYMEKNADKTNPMLWISPATWPQAVGGELASRFNLQKRILDAQYFGDIMNEKEAKGKFQENIGPRVDQKNEYNIIFPNVVGPVSEKIKQAAGAILDVVDKNNDPKTLKSFVMSNR